MHEFHAALCEWHPFTIISLCSYMFYLDLLSLVQECYWGHGTGVGWDGLGFLFVPKVFSGIEVMVLWMPLEFFNTSFHKTWSLLCAQHRALSCWSRFGIRNSTSEDKCVLLILLQHFKEDDHGHNGQLSTYFWPYCLPSYQIIYFVFINFSYMIDR